MTSSLTGENDPGPDPGDDGQLAAACWALPIAMSITRQADGVFLRVNSTFEELTGYTRDEVVGRTAALLGFIGERPRREWVEAKLQDRVIAHFEWTLSSKSGEARKVLVSVRGLRYGGEACLLSSLVDITEREKSRAWLWESEEWYRRLVSKSADPMFVAEWTSEGCAGRYREINEAAQRLLGWTREEMMQKAPADLAAPEDPLSHAEVRRLLESVGQATFERTVLTKDGRRLQVEVRANVLTWRGNRRLVSQWRDITARRLAERALLEAKSEFERLAEVAPVGIYRMDPAGHMRYANPAAQRLIGRSRATLYGKHFTEIIAEADRARVSERWQEVLAGGPPVPLEARVIWPGGEMLWYLTQAQRVVGADGVSEVVGSVVNISEQHAMAAALAALVEAGGAGDAFFSHLVSRIAAAVDMEFAGIVLDGPQPADSVRVVAWWRDGQLVEEQLVAREVMPGGEIAGTAPRVCLSGCAEVMPNSIREWAPGAVAAGVVPLLSTEGRRLGYLGVFGRRPLAAAAGLRRVLEFVADRCVLELERGRQAAKLRQVEQHLVRSQKFQALGTLAGGVAHDFNNVLTAMINYTTLAREMADEPIRQEYLGQVIAAGRRAQDLVHQILKFGRRQALAESKPEPVSVSTVIEETFALLRVAIPKSIKLEKVVDPSTPPVLADSRQLHQVLMNLGINAAQAIGSRPGVITVTLAPCLLDEAAAELLEGVAPGRHVCLRVSDSGCGMDEATISRIFEPYFTTKPEGEGTGLGLAMVWQILEEHHAGVRVLSRLGEGSTFELYLPAADAAKETVAAGAHSAVKVAKSYPRVLLVEGTDLKLRSRRAELEALGCRVTAFARASDALAAFWVAPSGFDLVIAQWKMPEFGGEILVERIRVANAQVPILLFSTEGGADGEPLAPTGTERLPLDLPAAEFAQVVARRLA